MRISYVHFLSIHSHHPFSTLKALIADQGFRKLSYNESISLFQAAPVRDPWLLLADPIEPKGFRNNLLVRKYNQYTDAKHRYWVLWDATWTQHEDGTYLPYGIHLIDLLGNGYQRISWTDFKTYVKGRALAPVKRDDPDIRIWKEAPPVDPKAISLDDPPP